jgi:hypothetical protein
MPRSSRAQSKKDEKKLASLAAFLKSQGHDASQVEEAIKDVPATSDEKMLEAEAVLLHLQSPGRFISKKCKGCDGIFGTSYRSVSYCSDRCRAIAIQTQTGIHWNPRVDRWANLRAEAPLVIRPEAYSQLVEFAKAILAQNQIEIQTPTQEDQEIPDHQVTYLEGYLPQGLMAELTLPQFGEENTIPVQMPLELNGHAIQDNGIEDDPFDF